MSKILAKLSAKLFHYFNNWQLTIAFIFLLMQVVMLPGIFASGYGGSSYINYWILLGYGWFNMVFVWMVLSIIATSLLIFWVFQFLHQRATKKITLEAGLMVLLALVLATFHIFMQTSSGYYQQVSSLSHGDREYHLVHRSSTKNIGFGVIDCDKTSLFCHPMIQIPIESYRPIKKGWDSNKALLTYKNNTLTIKTPTKSISVDQSLKVQNK